MTGVIPHRMTAEIDGDFVIFLIGFRINKIWKIWKWLPVFLAMPRMLKELWANPDLGFLHAQGHFGVRRTMLVQYWRSFEQLEAYAKALDRKHLPAWQAFTRRTKNNTDVGIWHETYLVSAGHYQSVYHNMAPYGLGLAGELVPATGRKASARSQIVGRNDAAKSAS